jgi:addiction module HigA family antidote
VTRQQLYKVIKGESAISPEMAIRLEMGIGSTADTWLRMQINYDLAQLRNRGRKIKLRRFKDPHRAEERV